MAWVVRADDMGGVMPIEPQSTEEDPLNLEIGRCVAAAMKRRGVRGKELASKVPGLTATKLSDRLNGHTPFRANELARIAEELETTVSEMLKDLTLRRQLSTVTRWEGQLAFDDIIDLPELERQERALAAVS